MNALFAIVVLLSCTDKSTGVETVYTGPPRCTDCDGWNEWVDELEADFWASGLCPTEPPDQVATPDGTMVDADVYVLDSGDGYGWGRYEHRRRGTTWFELNLVEDGKTTLCDEDNRDFPWESRLLYTRTPSPGSLSINAGNYSADGHVVVPSFGRALDHAGTSSAASLMSSMDLRYGVNPERYFLYDDAWREDVASAVLPASVDSPTGSYYWLCLESIETTDDWEMGPGRWRGSMFIHTAWWVKDGEWYRDEGPPKYLFIRLDELDCTFPEDASWYGDINDAYCEHWGSRCDGIDNDMDGVIDEGQDTPVTPWLSDETSTLDDDGNGTPDCMDDWDDDGVPNFQDEDVNDCCYDFDWEECL